MSREFPEQDSRKISIQKDLLSDSNLPSPSILSKFRRASPTSAQEASVEVAHSNQAPVVNETVGEVEARAKGR